MKHLLALLSITLIMGSTLAQQGDIKTIDNTGNGDFPNVSTAIEYINTNAIPAGGITLQLTDGQIFVDSLPQITAQPTINNPLIITRTGGGEMPTIAYEADSDMDLLKLANIGHTTIDGIKFDDINTDTESTRFYYRAIYIQNGQSITIKNCKFSNFSKYGIHIDDASVNVTIEHNTITHNTNFESPETTVYGIFASYDGGSDSLLINSNHIYGLKSVNGSVYGIRTQGYNALVSNNMIAINSPEKAYGLRIDAFDERVTKVHFNTILLSGAANQKGFAVDFEGAGGDVFFSNNIVINNRSTAIDTNQLVVKVGYDGPNHMLSHNIYYLSDVATSFQANFYNNACSTLEQWQTYSATDSASRIFNVAFADADNGDLHINNTMALVPELAGHSNTEVPTDFDNEERGLLPYIGADEDAHNSFPYYELTLSPTTLAFPEIQLGGESTMILDISNQLNSDTEIASIISPNGFLMSTGSENFNDTLLNITISPNGSIPLSVKFQPQAIQVYSGHIQINAGVQTFIAQVLGEGLSPDMTVSASEIEFGEIAIHTDSIKPFSITNTSLAPLDIAINTPTDFYFRKSNDAEWETNATIQLAIDETISGEIRYKPEQYNFYIDTLTIISDNLNLSIPTSGRSIGVDFQVETSLQGLWYSQSDWADFDNDADMDLLFSGYGLSPGAGETYIYENKGNFGFEKLETNFTGLGNPGAKWVDYDNDGDMDIFISGQAELDVYKTFFYTNNGDGTFTEWESEDIESLISASVCWADYTRNGYLDLLITGTKFTDDGPIPLTKIYTNNGDGTFTNQQHSLPNVTNGQAKWADYDNDGDLDVALMGSSEGSYNFIAKLYKNEDGQYQEVEIPATGIRYGQVHWGDYNNDSHLDLLFNGSFSNNEGSIAYVLKNEGDGTFSQTDLMQYGARQGGSEWIDLDNDGDLDIVFNGVYNNNLWLGRYYVYNDQETYQLVDTLVELKYADISFVDVNNDNRIDMFLAGRYDYQDYRAYIYKNHFHLQNTPPSPPSELMATTDTCNIELTWTPGIDQNGSSLTYNLRIGSSPSTGDIYNGSVSPNGDRLINAPGNMGTTTFLNLPCLPVGNYYAAVQSVDHSNAASPWSNEVHFEITFNGITKIENTSFQLYPNPTNDYINIQFQDASEREYSIVIQDITGRILVQKNIVLDSGQMEHRLKIPRNSKPGIYVLIIENNARHFSKLFTITN